MFGLFGTFEFVVGVLFSALVLLSTMIWTWTLVECAVTERNHHDQKVGWLLLILFTHVLGAALYCFVRRPKRLLEQGITRQGEERETLQRA